VHGGRFGGSVYRADGKRTQSLGRTWCYQERKEEDGMLFGGIRDLHRGECGGGRVL
jgi:hypothetical protein